MSCYLKLNEPTVSQALNPLHYAGDKFLKKSTAYSLYKLSHVLIMLLESNIFFSLKREKEVHDRIHAYL